MKKDERAERVRAAINVLEEALRLCRAYLGEIEAKEREVNSPSTNALFRSSKR